MDTRFWGPDGWRLMHSIVVNYPTNPTKLDKEMYKLFFESVEYVLPCIYCRNSFHQYIRELPIDSSLENNKKLSKWMYEIHNKVNQKLLSQRLHVNTNNDFEGVHQHYLDFVNKINNTQCSDPIPGWNIIYCILFNYPLSSKKIELERYQGYITFFYTLGYVIPFQKFKRIYQDYIRINRVEEYMNRKGLKIWGYNLEKYASSILLIECPNYRQRCHSIELFRAGCNGKNDPKPTCHVDNYHEMKKS